MYRWSVCPGSVKLSQGVEVPSSIYAEDGSDAHALAAYCFQRKVEPKSTVGHTIAYAERIFDVSQEMAEAVATYVDECEADAEPGDVDLTEHSFDLSAIHPGCFGTCDRVTWRSIEKLLIVRDFKYGAGIPVSPVDNAQLKYYGLGALLTCGFPAERVRLQIVQPRCDHPEGIVRHWDISAIDLRMDFSIELKAFAQATEAPDAPLKPGDHCRFCPAAAMKCPAIKARAQEVAKLEFSAEPLAPKYDPEQLKFALDSIPIMQAWIKNVHEFAYAEAEAGRFTSYKLVDKRATRKWRDEEDACAEIRIALGTAPDVYEPRALLSPAKIEKLKGVKKGQFDHLTVKESSGFTLVPLDDPRPAAKLSAQEDFKAIEVTPQDPLALPAFLDRKTTPASASVLFAE